MFALSRVPRAPHTHTGTRLEPCLSLPHSSFQDRVLEVLMNSLLIPLSGESNCGGRAGGGLLLLWPSCRLLINSRSGSVPGRSSPNLFLVACGPPLPPPPPNPMLCCLLNSRTSISMGVIGVMSFWYLPPSVCPYTLSGLVPLHLYLTAGEWEVLLVPWMGRLSVSPPGTPTLSLGLPIPPPFLSLPCPSPPGAF